MRKSAFRRFERMWHRNRHRPFQPMYERVLLLLYSCTSTVRVLYEYWCMMNPYAYSEIV
jgi:hypothetical protein